jgi:hypothetical protein
MDPQAGARPYRVETFSDAEDQFGYRVCDANGNLIQEGSETFSTRLQAVKAAKGSVHVDGAVFLDEPQPR